MIDFLWWIIDSLQRYNGAVTAVATVFIFIFTATIWCTARSQLKHTRQIERAYLSAMGPSAAKDGIPQFYRLEVSNNGKTPATLLQIAVEIQSLGKIQQGPKYLVPGYKRTPYRRVFYPGERDTKLSGHSVPPGIDEPFVYGRLWYSDIWGEKHIHSFLLKMEPGGTTVQVDAPNIPGEYYRWD